MRWRRVFIDLMYLWGLTNQRKVLGFAWINTLDMALRKKIQIPIPRFKKEALRGKFLLGIMRLILDCMKVSSSSLMNKKKSFPHTQNLWLFGMVWSESR
mmetsp:Transcript_6918/g.12381  ORF Transcript_6918/g.12381 Transcript_6918/m.12381 type:complete len:99 (-) Transcript_6918:111-407(-)